MVSIMLAVKFLLFYGMWFFTLSLLDAAALAGLYRFL